MVSIIKSLLMCIAIDATSEFVPSWSMFEMKPEAVSALLALRDEAVQKAGVEFSREPNALSIESRFFPVFSEKMELDFDSVTLDVTATFEGFVLNGLVDASGEVFHSHLVSWESLQHMLMNRAAGVSTESMTWLMPNVLLCAPNAGTLNRADVLEELWASLGEELEFHDEADVPELSDDEKAISAMRDYLPTQDELSECHAAAAE